MSNYRVLPGVGAEVSRTFADITRQTGNEEIPRIAGMAAPFNSRTVLYSGKTYREEELYEEGCFDETLKDASMDVMSCYNHDRIRILGRQANNTLKVWTDRKGLHYEVDIDRDDSEAMRVYALVKRGTVRGSSIRARIEDADYDVKKEDGVEVVTLRITKMTLKELGPVSDPAYEDTSAVSRSKPEDSAARSYIDFLRATRL